MPFGSIPICPRTETNVSICGNKQGSKMGSWRLPELKLEESVMVVTEPRLLRFPASRPPDSPSYRRSRPVALSLLVVWPVLWRTVSCRVVSCPVPSTTGTASSSTFHLHRIDPPLWRLPYPRKYLSYPSSNPSSPTSLPASRHQCTTHSSFSSLTAWHSSVP